jgi:prepilin-type N-terminal cleavage/methylation domain-containing protein
MKRGQRGFTLVEMLLGLAILSIIALAMAGTFLVAYRAVSTEARTIAADEAVSGASVWLTRDLNSAAALPVGTVNAGNTVTLTYGSPVVTVVYSVNSTNDLVRTVNGTATTAARGITSIVLSAAGCYATVTIQPSATGATAATFNVSNRPGGCW